MGRGDLGHEGLLAHGARGFWGTGVSRPWGEGIWGTRGFSPMGRGDLGGTFYASACASQASHSP
ncbi:MAG: hypothetical protein RR147_00435, partial [Oscillospiraceae bacterium]